ncbi:MAG TPA: hypothetical protein VFU05_18650, partial [Cyclobacteriaceae bacterium]|nr:hypothetical protein [Cyclobacteriaceae bacterium]
MRTLFVTFFTVFIAFGCIAQFGNEWIKFNQQYYKIPVAKDGIYRLTYADLENAGFPAGSTDPRRIQIFHRGIEQHIRVQGEIDAIFNASDYIEFYGKKNDGVSDAELYQPASTQPHQYYNLYSDTTAYFLTVNPLPQQGLRMEEFFSNNLPILPAETSHRDQKLRVLTTQYATGQLYSTYLQNSFFETGEGWTGDLIIQNSFIDYTIENILFTSQAAGNPQLEIQVMGRANLSHVVEISVGPSAPSRVVANQSFPDSEVRTISVPLNWSDIGVDGRLVVRVRAMGAGGAADRLSASYIKVMYPQSFNQSGVTEKIFQL